MNRIDIELLNKHYNCKERKKYDSFNLKMNKKRRKRLSRVDKKPLSEREKFLFENDKILKEPILTCAGFYKCNGISHVLFDIAKTQLNTFYEETRLLNARFPTKDYILTSIMDEFNKNAFLSIAGPNRFGIQHISEIEPSDSKISKYVKTIFICAFGISYDSVCIDFQIQYTTSFLKQFNDMLINEFETNVEYKRIYVNGSYSISKCYPLLETARAQYADDVLFEIKSRVVDFLKDHYSSLSKYSYTPFSVDEYRTNLKHDDRFINCFGYSSLSEKDLLKFNYHNSSNKLKSGLLHLDYREIIKHPFYNLHRGRLLFIVPDDEYAYVQQSLDFIMMFFVQMNEIDKYKETLSKKYALFEKVGKNRYLSFANVYKSYANLCLSVNNSQILLDFEKIKILPYVSNDSYLKVLIEYLKEETLGLNLRNERLDEKINNILSSKNNASSMMIAIVALIVSALSTSAAIATLIITFFLP